MVRNKSLLWAVEDHHLNILFLCDQQQVTLCYFLLVFRNGFGPRIYMLHNPNNAGHVNYQGEDNIYGLVLIFKHPLDNMELN